MASRASDRITRYRAVALAAFVVIGLLGFVYPRLISNATGLSGETDPQRRSQTKGAQTKRRRATRVIAPASRRDYSKFSHRIPQHQQQACDSCHKFPSPNWKEVRKGDEAFPDVTEYPEHSSCINCHRQQFFTNERPAPSICSVCHVQVTPLDTRRHPFPNPTEIFELSKKGQGAISAFGINFSHDKHAELVGQNDPARRADTGVRFISVARSVLVSKSQTQESASKSNESCSVCHQTYQPQGDAAEEFVNPRPKGLPEDAFWLKKGTFKTTPRNHALCFTCHAPENDIKPVASDCAACHKLIPASQLIPTRTDFDPAVAAKMGITDRVILSKWRKRDSSATFRHEAHPDASCAACHHPAVMNTLDAKTLRVPVQSCGGEGCHITATADEGGILNFEADKRKADPAFQCAKCHLSFGRERMPETHLKAVQALQTK